MVSWTATSSTLSKIAIQHLVIKGKLVPSSSCSQEDIVIVIKVVKSLMRYDKPRQIYNYEEIT